MPRIDATTATAASWVTASDDGWFNYAPNAGVVFSSGDPGLDRERIGLVLAGAGLALTAGAMARSSLRRGPNGSAA